VVKSSLIFSLIPQRRHHKYGNDDESKPQQQDRYARRPVKQKLVQ
jgi:hypothetical protein